MNVLEDFLNSINSINVRGSGINFSSSFSSSIVDPCACSLALALFPCGFAGPASSS